MLETAVGDGAKQLSLQEEIAETGRMDTDVAALLVDIVTGGELALLAVGGSRGGLVATDLLVGVINEIFLVRHVDCDSQAVRLLVWKLSRKLFFTAELR
jgi:hypothetical protein